MVVTTLVIATLVVLVDVMLVDRHAPAVAAADAGADGRGVVTDAELGVLGNEDQVALGIGEARRRDDDFLKRAGVSPGGVGRANGRRAGGRGK